MDEPVILGDPAHLQFELRWEVATMPAAATAADATRGTLRAHLAGRPVWGSNPERPSGFTWTWVELLEHLARHWAFILIEEGDPLGLGVPPEQLRAKVEERWSAITEEQQAAEEELLWSYLQSHDLSSALAGAYPTSMWLTREGNSLRVACKNIVVSVPLHEGRTILSELGDAIAERLSGVAVDPRAGAAIAAWTARETIQPRQLVQIATGLEGDAIDSLTDVVAVTTLEFDDAFRPDEYLAVARMAGSALAPSELSNLFSIIRAQPEVWTGPLDRAAEGVAAVLTQVRDKPLYDQGRAAARWLREHLSISEQHRTDPEEILTRWNVPLVDIKLSSAQLDAVSVWGPRRGPAVILNRKGPHGRFNGRRATVAHEIGHLVMDRSDALPVAEVMGGRMSSRVEARARAFAAEFLVPERVAGQEVLEAATMSELGEVVNRVAERYGASRELVAWQVYNALDRRPPPMVATYLRSLVTNPQGFWPR